MESVAISLAKLIEMVFVDTAEYYHRPLIIASIRPPDRFIPPPPDRFIPPTKVIGTKFDDLLQGSSGGDILDGGSGADTLIGNGGDDTFIVDQLGDVALESRGEGWDLVRSAVDYRLGIEVEDLVLTGTRAFKGFGNEIDNGLVGNSRGNWLSGESGNDWLVGGLGADTLIGGFGNDLYHVDSRGDKVIEFSNQGRDIVFSSTSYTLPDNIEVLWLEGPRGLLGTGNASDNWIVGNEKNNRLDGSAGNDTIIGGRGRDTLKGGAGSDEFRFFLGDSGQRVGFDLISDFERSAYGLGDSISVYDTMGRRLDLAIAGTDQPHSPSEASIDQQTGIANFSEKSGRSLADALFDITRRIATAGDNAGEIALFKVAGKGDYHLFVSDGQLGLTTQDLVIKLAGINTLSAIEMIDGVLLIG